MRGGIEGRGRIAIKDAAQVALRAVLPMLFVEDALDLQVFVLGNILVEDRERSQGILDSAPNTSIAS